MKRIAITALLILLSSFVFAADFSPTKLEIQAGSVIQYDFDGTELSIPVTVNGTSAEAVFFVFTKDKAATITEIRNGFLGWHYVNKVDTCIYTSSNMQLTTGKNTINWDGKDTDDNIVPAGDYTYYIWGFDSFNTRQQALPDDMYVQVSRRQEMLQYDEAGTPLAKPVAQINEMRWILGSDPLDATLIETTSFPDVGLSYVIGLIW